MRRREKFVLSAIVLSFGLFTVQHTAISLRYYAVLFFTVISYFISWWALKDDLQSFERYTVVPFPAMYSLSVSLFYFLLPSTLLSQGIILFLFAVGTYGLLLTCNIFSVAKGRTIQLLHAAHAIGLIFTLIISLLLLNSIFSLKFPFYINGVLVGITHFPLIFMSLWSVRVKSKIDAEIIRVAVVLSIVMVQFSVLFSFLPLTVWHQALFMMSVLYVGLGLLHNFFKGKLFENTVREYTVLAFFILLVFWFTFPLK